MKPEQQRIAIAKACGWLQSKTCYWEGWWYLKKGKRAYHKTAPDYLNDLNAMHEAEKMLTEAQWVVYGRELSRLNVFPMVHATAAQRAEAFLRTLKLWEVTE